MNVTGKWAVLPLLAILAACAPLTEAEQLQRYERDIERLEQCRSRGGVPIIRKRHPSVPPHVFGCTGDR